MSTLTAPLFANAAIWLSVGVTNNAIVSAALIASPRGSGYGLIYPQLLVCIQADSGIVAALAALVGAPVANTIAAVASTGSLCSAYTAALSNATPTVPGMDQTTARLILANFAA